MKIKVNEAITNLENKKIESIGVNGQIEKDLEGNPIYVTFRSIIANALNSFQQDKPLSAEQKNKSWQIMKKLYDGDEVDLTVDDCAFIKERVGLIYTPLIFGRVSDLFETK